jgi:hypothetical protein
MGNVKKDLAVQTKSAALALPDDIVGSMVIEGDDSSTKLGRISLYQGTSQEQATYGEGVFRRGDFVDVLERRKLATSSIIPIHAEVKYQRWDKDSKLPAYTYSAKDRNLIPAEDLAWNGDEPPLAAKLIDMVVVVRGEPYPYLFSFKRTGLRAGELILQFEKRRALKGIRFSMYDLGSEDEKNNGGNVFRRLTVKNPVDVPEDCFDVLRAVTQALATVKAQAAKVVQVDDVPF